MADYLLSPTHRTGRHKTVFFKRFGFSATAWTALADALRRHAAEHEVSRAEDTAFGRRYVVDGMMRTPDGRAPMVRSVWFIEAGEEAPRLATAYPLERTRQ